MAESLGPRILSYAMHWLPAAAGWLLRSLAAGPEGAPQQKSSSQAWARRPTWVRDPRVPVFIGQKHPKLCARPPGFLITESRSSGTGRSMVNGTFWRTRAAAECTERRQGGGSCCPQGCNRNRAWPSRLLCQMAAVCRGSQPASQNAQPPALARLSACQQPAATRRPRPTPPRTHRQAGDHLLVLARVAGGRCRVLGALHLFFLVAVGGSRGGRGGRQRLLQAPGEPWTGLGAPKSRGEALRRPGRWLQ